MLPSGAAAGPSVSPPWILALRVNNLSSLASGGTMLSPVGLGSSADAYEERPMKQHRAKAVKRMEAPEGFGNWDLGISDLKSEYGTQIRNPKSPSAYRCGGDFST